MAQLTIDVCDICRNPSRPARKYKIEVEGVKIAPVLCSMHSGPLDKLILTVSQDTNILVEAESTVRPLRRRPGRSPRAMSMAEVERRKREHQNAEKRA